MKPAIFMTRVSLAIAFMLSAIAFGQVDKASDRNTNASVEEVRKAAEQGDANAQFRLGNSYNEGQGVPRDYAEAVRWYRKAADQGNAKAQMNLGTKYANGQGVSRDYAEAARWYRKAADQGTAEAQYNLGVSYMQGQGVPQDKAEAVRWLRKAAEQGVALAQYNLAVCYYLGDGTPKNSVEAYTWLELAIAGGETDGIKVRDMVAGEMTPAQIAEAQSRARDRKATTGVSAQKSETVASIEQYQEADPQELHLAYRASMRQLQMDASGQIAKIDYTITKFAVGAVDIELTTNKVEIDPDDQKFGTISTKNFGTLRLTFDSSGTASLWLKPSQRKDLLNLLK